MIVRPPIIELYKNSKIVVEKFIAEVAFREKATEKLRADCRPYKNLVQVLPVSAKKLQRFLGAENSLRQDL
jgi:hypothetical protein